MIYPIKACILLFARSTFYAQAGRFMDRFQNGHETAAQAAGQQELWILGQPPLKKYLDFVDDLGREGANGIRSDRVNEWRNANDYYELLMRTERNIADAIETFSLPSELDDCAAELAADPRFRHTFESLPTAIKMVELDRLVVCQNHVNRNFVEMLKSRLGQAADIASLFRFCLPLEEYQAPVQIREADSRRYIFRSSSTDFRFHEALMLKPGQISGHESFGQIAGVIGLVVGFSSNFLNAIHDDDSGRLVLNNGYHRACALSELGITHAPCIVQTVTRRDELDLIAKPIVANDPGYFFNSPRPPLLKDFKDPKIRKLCATKKVARTIEVSYEIRDYLVEE
ncbi:hypothetical protein [Noviherbaspirillum suwonense]|nr:hypothetical protein [Noviherbaspirillum suwonense]